MWSINSRRYDMYPNKQDTLSAADMAHPIIMLNIYTPHKLA